MDRSRLGSSYSQFPNCPHVAEMLPAGGRRQEQEAGAGGRTLEEENMIELHAEKRRRIKSAAVSASCSCSCLLLLLTSAMQIAQTCLV
jgi:hypothetical protein